MNQDLETKTLYKVDPTTIKVLDGWNPRVDFGDIDSLKDSIIENGVLLPLTLKRTSKGNLNLIDGERRLRAVLAAIKEVGENIKVPAFIEDRNLTTTNALCRALISNDGKPLKPYEEAEAIGRLVKWGNTVEQIAKKLGKHRSYVSRRLEFLDAGVEVQNARNSGMLSQGDCLDIIKESEGDEEVQKKLVKEKKYTSKKSRKVEGITEKLNIMLEFLEPQDELISNPLRHIIEEIIKELNGV